MSNKTASHIINSVDYERRKLVNYFMDSGFSEAAAKLKVGRMTDKRVVEVYDSIPEEGEE